ncbi:MULTISPECIES: membrane-associated oxidoreductase [unclassified Streptomyces]|uniref:membrane-associated oxidoreductase n=1 Tax=unclassified Streptomyces TaxID=2593676 RepID=UPI0011CD74E4|nr:MULTISPECIES: membrane-associated oxidoreductase [unclassified Streptomyces]TXS62222.1 membrane-associated oxidoreductase [Streptomyces sp. me109]
MIPADLTPAECRVRDAFPLGEGVDFREGADEDPADGASWGPERTVRAEVLRALLIGGAARDGEIAGLRLSGARVTGRLDLTYGTVDHPVRLRFCHFEQDPNLYGARLRNLVLSDSVLPGLTAGTLRVEGVLRLSCCRVSGQVGLQGAKISGAVFLNGATLGVPPDPDAPPPGPGAPEPPVEPALQLNHAEVGTDVWAVGLVAHGQVRLNGATLGGQLNLDDAELHAPGGTALHAETLSVGTDLRAMRLRAHGRVNLSGARIPHQLNLAYARLSNPGGPALRASSCVIGELWLREAAPIVGTVNLRRSQLDLLHVPPETWPGRVRLDGLSYRALAPHLPAVVRLPLLEREESGYLPYAYEQLAAAYRTAGDDAAARTVQLAKLRRHRGTLSRAARFWGFLQDATVGYGFRPMRAAGWLLLLLCTGALAFALHPPHALKPSEAPGFNPLAYTLDLLLPLVDFGQEAAFAPRGWYQWLSYLLIATGWILATTIAAGVTRSLNRQ